MQVPMHMEEDREQDDKGGGAAKGANSMSNGRVPRGRGFSGMSSRDGDASGSESGASNANARGRKRE